MEGDGWELEEVEFDQGGGELLGACGRTSGGPHSLPEARDHNPMAAA